MVREGDGQLDGDRRWKGGEKHGGVGGAEWFGEEGVGGEVGGDGRERRVRGGGSLGAGVGGSGVTKDGGEELVVVEDLEEGESAGIGFFGVGLGGDSSAGTSVDSWGAKPSGSDKGTDRSDEV